MDAHPPDPAHPDPGAAGAGEATAPDEVAAARARLAELDDLPVEEHVAVYEDVHHRLQEALADVEPDERRDDGVTDP